MGTQQNYNVTVTIDGSIIGTFDNMTGGEIDSESSKHRSGGMGAQKVYGGPKMVGDVTVTRVFDRERDAPELFHRLARLVGKGRCTVSKQPLDADGNANYPPIVYRGVLKTLTPGEVNSNSADVDTYDLVVTTEGDIA